MPDKTMTWGGSAIPFTTTEQSTQEVTFENFSEKDRNTLTYLQTKIEEGESFISSLSSDKTNIPEEDRKKAQKTMQARVDEDRATYLEIYDKAKVSALSTDTRTFAQKHPYLVNTAYIFNKIANIPRDVSTAAIGVATKAQWLNSTLPTEEEYKNHSDWAQSLLKEAEEKYLKESAKPDVRQSDRQVLYDAIVVPAQRKVAIDASFLFERENNINVGNYFLNNGHGYPEVTQDNIQELRNKLFKGAGTPEELARIRVALEANPNPPSVSAEQANAELQTRGNYANLLHNPLDAVASVVASQLPNYIKAPSPVGIVSMVTDMYDEQVEDGYARAEELGIAYNAEDSFKANMMSAIIQGGLEAYVDKISLGFIKGVSARSIMEKFALDKVGRLGLLKKAQQYAVESLKHVLREGSEEVLQSATKMVMTEAEMKGLAERQGIEYTGRPAAQILKELQQSWEMGTLGGVGVTTVGTAPMFSGLKGEIKSAVEEEKSVKGLRDEEVLTEVDNFKTGAARFGADVMSTSDKAFRARLEDMSEEALVKLAKQIGLLELGATRADLINTLMENKDSIGEYQAIARQKMLDTIAGSDHTEWEKFVFSTVAETDISFSDIVGAKPVYEKLSKNAGYDSLEDFFAAESATNDRTKKRVEFFQTVEREYEGDKLAQSFLEVLKSREFLKQISYSLYEQAHYNPKTKTGVADDTVSGMHEWLHAAWDSFLEDIRPAISGMSEKQALSVLDWIEKYYEPKDKGRALHSVVGHSESSETRMGELRDRWSKKGNELRTLDEADVTYAERLMDEVFATMMSDYSLSSSRYTFLNTGYLNAASESGISLIRDILGDSVADIMQTVDEYEPSMKAKEGMEERVESTKKDIDAVLTEFNTLKQDLIDKYKIQNVRTKMFNVGFLSSVYNVHKSPAFRNAILGIGQEDLERMSPQDEKEYVQARQDVQGYLNDVKAYEGVVEFQHKVGNEVLGKISWNAEGKFVMELLRGSNILTLHHEFAHAFSRFLTDEVIKSIIDDTVLHDVSFLTMTNKQRSGVKGRMVQIMKAFQKDPYHNIFANKNSKNYIWLEMLQERLAYDFQTYLATEKAPTIAMDKAFSAASKAYMEYYRDVRKKLPESMQKVDPKVAKMFDDMIAGKDIPLRSETKEEGFKGLQEVRSRIKKMLKTLDTKHYSKEAVDLVNGLLKEIDTKSRTKVRVKGALDLKKVIREKLMDGGIDAELLTITQEELNDLLALDDIAFYNLSLQQLLPLESAIRDILNWDLQNNAAFIENKVEQFKVRGELLLSDLKKHWRYGTRVGAFKKAKDLHKTSDSFFDKLQLKYIGDLWNPYRALRHMAQDIGHVSEKNNEVMTALLDGLREGRTEQYKFEIMSRKFFNKIYRKAKRSGVSSVFGEVRDEDKKEITVIGPNGKGINIKVSLGEIMLWYGYTFNRMGRSRLRNGFTPRERPGEVYKFRSEEELQTIVTSLPEDLKSIVRDTMKFYDREVAPRINAVSRELIGRDIATEENYLPLFVEWLNRGASGAFNTKNMTEGSAQMFREFMEKGYSLETVKKNSRQFNNHMLQHMGFTNARTSGNSPVYLEDFFRGISHNIDDVAMYIGMAKPVTDIRTALFADRSVYDSLLTMYGKKRVDSIARWLDTLEDPSSRRDDITNLAVRLTQSIKRGLIKFSMSIPTMQLMSLHLARNAGLERKYIVKALGNNFLDFKNAKFNIIKMMEEMGEMSPYLNERFTHLPMVDLGGMKDSRARYLFLGKESIKERWDDAVTVKDMINVAREADEKAMMPTRMMDALVLYKIIEACKYKGEELGWDNATTIKYAEDIIIQTQPQIDPLYTSNFLSSRSPFTRIILGPFQSFRDIVRGEIQDSIDTVRAYRHGQATKQDVKNAAMQMLRAALITNMMAALVQTMFRRMGKDEEDKDLNVFIDWLLNVITNTFSLLPFYGNFPTDIINSKVRGWSSSMGGALVLDQPARIVEQITKASNAIERGDEDAWHETLKIFLESSTLFGHGFVNLDRFTEKIIKELAE